MEGLDDEWEVLPEGGGFFEIHDLPEDQFDTPSDNVFKNYFRCPSPRRNPSPPHQKFMPVPIQLEEPPTKHRDGDGDEVEELLKTNDLVINPVAAAAEKFDDQDRTLELLISSPKKQVFFIKKETITEFVDMKLDLESPKSNNKRPSTPPQLMGHHQFQAPASEEEGAPDAEAKISSPKKMMVEADGDDDAKKDEVEVEDQNHGGGNMSNHILKWSLTGIGAICSFGVATVCIFVLGGLVKNSGGENNNCGRNNQYQGPRHHKLEFHIYAEDKRLKQEATKLKEAVSAVREIPFSRAHITFGGYCDAH